VKGKLARQVTSAVPGAAAPSIDSNPIYARTDKGEQEILIRGDELSHETWLALVMVNGRFSAQDLENQEPKLEDFANSLALLATLGYIECVTSASPPVLERATGKMQRLESRQVETQSSVAKSAPQTASRVVIRHGKQGKGLARAGKRWGARLLIVILVGAVALAALLLFPLNPYLPAIQEQFSRDLGESVTVDSMRLALLPSPALVLERVRVGPNLKFETVRVRPDLASLLAPHITSTLELESAVLIWDDLTKLPALRRLGSLLGNFTLTGVEFKELALRLDEKTTITVSGKMEFAANQKLTRAQFWSGALTASFDPADVQSNLRISAKNWQLPTEPPLVIESLVSAAELTEHTLVVKEIRGMSNGGELTGTARLDWTNNWSVTGELRLRKLAASRVAALMTKDWSLAGTLNAEVKYSSHAGDILSLAKQSRIEARFRVIDGALHNLDIVEALKSASRHGVRGGKTGFDEFSGTLHVSSDNAEVQALKILSGVLNASGHVQISRAQELAGRLNVEFKPKANLGTLPLLVEGSLRDPVLKPVTDVFTPKSPAQAQKATLGQIQ
jgi:AsmA-like C-terminal region